MRHGRGGELGWEGEGRLNVLKRREDFPRVNPFSTAKKGNALRYPRRGAGNSGRARYYGAGEVTMDEKGGKWGLAVRAGLANLSPRKDTGETKGVVTFWYFGLERDFAGVTTNCTKKRVFRIGE